MHKALSPLFTFSFFSYQQALLQFLWPMCQIFPQSLRIYPSVTLMTENCLEVCLVIVILYRRRNNYFHDVRFEILTAVHRRFGGLYCLHLQGQKRSKKQVASSANRYCISYSMQRRIVRQKSTDASENCTASIFWVKSEARNRKQVVRNTRI